MKQAGAVLKSLVQQVGDKLAGLTVMLAAFSSTAAYAVNDLPGGPAVRQLNLHPAVTKIAEGQHW